MFFEFRDELGFDCIDGVVVEIIAIVAEYVSDYTPISGSLDSDVNVRRPDMRDAACLHQFADRPVHMDRIIDRCDGAKGSTLTDVRSHLGTRI